MARKKSISLKKILAGALIIGGLVAGADYINYNTSFKGLRQFFNPDIFKTGYIPRRKPTVRNSPKTNPEKDLHVKQDDSKLLIKIQRKPFHEGVLNHPNSKVIERIQQNEIKYPYDVILMADVCTPGEINFCYFLSQIEKIKPAPKFIMLTGDFLAPGRLKDYENYLNMIDSYNKIPIISVVGNHDLDFAGAKKHYSDFFGEEDFFFDILDERYIALNNANPPASHYGLTNSQLERLEDLLDDSTPRNKFVFMHVPPRWPIKDGTESTPDLYNVFNGNFFNSFNGFKNSDKFMELIEKYNVKIATFGHVHSYNNFKRDNTRYIVTGSGGQEIAEEKENPPNEGIFHDFLRLTIERDGHYKGQVYKGGVKPDTRYDFRN